jgi:lipoyl(octanoyl) transferase
MAAVPVLRDLGRAEYLPTWQAMREFTAGRTGETADELWVVEHPPVFTLGQGGRREHLRETGSIPIVATDRGGQVTYHGPGQVVVYTLIDLRRLGIFVKELVYRIEESVIQTLAQSGLAAERVRGAPGVYVRDPSSLAGGPLSGFAKIAALGIKVSRGCAYHGVALNVAMDLSPFSRIDPCGYRGLPATDLSTLGAGITWRAAADRLAARLQQHFTR